MHGIKNDVKDEKFGKNLQRKSNVEDCKKRESPSQKSKISASPL
jgi:hypothetical protein